jgi:hypothetical protein
VTVASPAAPEQQPKPKAKKGPAVCLDYVRGQCVRPNCKYPHPDLSVLQDLQGAEGKEPCEVFVLTGQCKFGAKCLKLHPAGKASLDTAASAPAPAPSPEVPAARSVIADHVAELEAGLEVEMEGFGDYILKSLESDGDWDTTGMKAVGQNGPATCEAGGRSLLRSVFGFDHIFMGLLRDINVGVSF